MKRINGEGSLLQAVTGRAFERSFFKSTFARTDPGQAHPVLAGGTHWPIGN
jgi:hypothetical protein